MALTRLILAVVLASALTVAVVGKTCSLTIQFDNSGRRVMSTDVDKKIRTALADKVFKVTLSQVVLKGGIGQSSLLNRQAIAIYEVTGTTTNGKTPCQNCVAGTKSGWFSDPTIKKAIKAATDTWIPNDKIEPQKFSCKEA